MRMEAAIKHAVMEVSLFEDVSYPILPVKRIDDTRRRNYVMLRGKDRWCNLYLYPGDDLDEIQRQLRDVPSSDLADLSTPCKMSRCWRVFSAKEFYEFNKYPWSPDVINPYDEAYGVHDAT